MIIDPVPPDEEHTTRKLVRALEAVPDPGGVPYAMIERASQGYYHDYLSPLTFPEMALVNELGSLANHPSRAKTPAGLAIMGIRQRVIDGEFDASRAESDKWAATPEGQAAFLSLAQPRRRKPT